MGNPFKDPNAPIKQKRFIYPLVAVALIALVASIVFMFWVNSQI